MTRHKHNWSAISSEATVSVDGTCVFVCTCGEIQKLKIPEHRDLFRMRGKKPCKIKKDYKK